MQNPSNIHAHNSVITDPGTLKQSINISADGGVDTNTISNRSGIPNTTRILSPLTFRLGRNQAQRMDISPHQSVIKKCLIHTSQENMSSKNATLPSALETNSQLIGQMQKYEISTQVVANKPQPDASTLSKRKGSQASQAYYAHTLNKSQYDHYLENKAKDERWKNCVETAVKVIQDSNNQMKKYLAVTSQQQTTHIIDAWTPVMSTDQIGSHDNLDQFGPMEMNQIKKLSNFNAKLDRGEAPSSVEESFSEHKSKRGPRQQSNLTNELGNKRVVLIQDNPNSTSVVDIPFIPQKTPNGIIMDKAIPLNMNRTPELRPLTHVSKISQPNISSLEESSKQSRNDRMPATMFTDQSKVHDTIHQSDADMNQNVKTIIRANMSKNQTPMGIEQSAVNSQIKMLTDNRNQEQDESSSIGKIKPSKNQDSDNMTIDKIISNDMQKHGFEKSAGDFDITLSEKGKFKIEIDQQDQPSIHANNDDSPALSRTMGENRASKIEKSVTPFQITSQVNFVSNKQSHNMEQQQTDKNIVTLQSYISPQTINNKSEMHITSNKDQKYVDSQVMTIQQSKTGSSDSPLSELKNITTNFQVHSGGKLNSHGIATPIYKNVSEMKQGRAILKDQSHQPSLMQNVQYLKDQLVGMSRDLANHSYQSSISNNTRNIENDLQNFENQVSFRAKTGEHTGSNTMESRMSGKFKQPRVINVMKQQRDLSIQFFAKKYLPNQQMEHDNKLKSLSLKKQLLRQRLLKQQYGTNAGKAGPPLLQNQVFSNLDPRQAWNIALGHSVSPKVGQMNNNNRINTELSYNDLKSHTAKHSERSFLRIDNEGGKLPGILSQRGANTSKVPQSPQSIDAFERKSKFVLSDQRSKKMGGTQMLSPVMSLHGDQPLNQDIPSQSRRMIFSQDQKQRTYSIQQQNIVNAANPNLMVSRIYSTDRFDSSNMQAFHQAKLRTMSGETQLASPGYQGKDLAGGLAIKSCNNQKFSIEAYRQHIQSKQIRFRMELRKMREMGEKNQSIQSQMVYKHNISSLQSKEDVFSNSNLFSPTNVSELPVNGDEDTKTKTDQVDVAEPPVPQRSKFQQKPQKNKEKVKTILEAIRHQSFRDKKDKTRLNNLQRKNYTKVIKNQSKISQPVTSRGHPGLLNNQGNRVEFSMNQGSNNTKDYIMINNKQQEGLINSIYQAEDSLYDSHNDNRRFSTHENKKEQQYQINGSIQENFKGSINTDKQLNYGKCYTHRDFMSGNETQRFSEVNDSEYRFNFLQDQRQIGTSRMNGRRQSQVLSDTNKWRDGPHHFLQLRDKKQYNKKDFYLNLFKLSKGKGDQIMKGGNDLSVVASSKVSKNFGEGAPSYTEDTQRADHSDIKVDGQNISDIQANQVIIQEFVKLITQNLQQSADIVENNNVYIQNMMQKLNDQNSTSQTPNQSNVKSQDLQIAKIGSMPLSDGQGSLRRTQHEIKIGDTFTPPSPPQASSQLASSVLSSMKRLQEKSSNKVNLQQADKIKIQELHQLQHKILEQQTIIKNLEVAHNSWIMQIGNETQLPHANRPVSQDVADRKNIMVSDSFSELKNNPLNTIGTGLEHQTVLQVIENQISRNNYIVNTLDENYGMQQIEIKGSTMEKSEYSKYSSKMEQVFKFGSKISNNAQEAHKYSERMPMEPQIESTKIHNNDNGAKKKDMGVQSMKSNSKDDNIDYDNLGTQFMSMNLKIPQGMALNQVSFMNNGNNNEMATGLISPHTEESSFMMKRMDNAEQQSTLIKNIEEPINYATGPREVVTSKSYELSHIRGPDIPIEESQQANIEDSTMNNNPITEQSVFKSARKVPPLVSDTFNNDIKQLSNNEAILMKDAKTPSKSSPRSTARKSVAVVSKSNQPNQQNSGEQVNSMGSKNRATPELSSQHSPIISQHIYEQQATFQNAKQGASDQNLSQQEVMSDLANSNLKVHELIQGAYEGKDQINMDNKNNQSTSQTQQVTQGPTPESTKTPNQQRLNHNIPTLPQPITASFNLKKIDCTEKLRPESNTQSSPIDQSDVDGQSPITVNTLDKIVKWNDVQNSQNSTAEKLILQAQPVYNKDIISKDEKRFNDALDRNNRSINLQVESDISKSLNNYSLGKADSIEETVVPIASPFPSPLPSPKQQHADLPNYEIMSADNNKKLPKTKIKNNIKFKEQLLDKLNRFIVIEDKMKVATRLDIRKQFAHGMPDNLNGLVKQNIGLNTSSPSYKANNIMNQPLSPKSKAAFLNQVIMKSKLTSQLNMNNYQSLNLHGTHIDITPQKTQFKKEKINIIRRNQNQPLVESVEYESDDDIKKQDSIESAKKELSRIFRDKGNSQTSKTIDPASQVDDQLAMECLEGSFSVQERIPVNRYNNQKKVTVHHSALNKPDSEKDLKKLETIQEYRRPNRSEREATPQDAREETLMHPSEQAYSDHQSPMAARKLSNQNA